MPTCTGLCLFRGCRALQESKRRWPILGLRGRIRQQRMRTACSLKQWVGCNPDAHPFQTDPGTSVSRAVSWRMHRTHAGWWPAASHGIHIQMAWHNLRGRKPRHYVYYFAQRCGSILATWHKRSLWWTNQSESSVIQCLLWKWDPR